MPFPRRRSKKPSSHNGKLMIVLRNRHTAWIDVGPADGPALRAKIQGAMELQGQNPERADQTADLAPHGEDTVRLEDIVHVKYIGPKSASESEPEPKAKQP